MGTSPEPKAKGDISHLAPINLGASDPANDITYAANTGFHPETQNPFNPPEAQLPLDTPVFSSGESAAPYTGPVGQGSGPDPVLPPPPWGATQPRVQQLQPTGLQELQVATSGLWKAKSAAKSSALATGAGVAGGRVGPEPVREATEEELGFMKSCRLLVQVSPAQG